MLRNHRSRSNIPRATVAAKLKVIRRAENHRLLPPVLEQTNPFRQSSPHRYQPPNVPEIV